MRIIALFGRENIGKTCCLGHLINLIHRETEGCNYLYEGLDDRVTLDYLDHRITICTFGDNKEEERHNIEKIRKDNPYIAIVATRTKGATVEIVEKFCSDMGCQLKWVEKYVASFDNLSGQEYLNNLQAEQLLDYIRGLISGQLYYVDSISAIDREETRYHVSLIGIELPNDGFPRTLSLEMNANELHYQNSEASVKEDDFVLYRPDSENRFLPGDQTEEAIELRNTCRNLREELLGFEKHNEFGPELTQIAPDWVKSYHVNVGHGNCSLILSNYGTEYELWMVDCSTYDYTNRRDYSQNLYQCLKNIALELKKDITNLRISRFMLTHTHFDHYNGLLFLIKHGFVNDKTLVYANLHYDCASPVWTKILNEFKKLHCHFVEPITSNQTKGLINIYHPKCTTTKSKSSDPNCHYVPKVNNSSVVYGIALSGHIMVFPGDLEQDGFKAMCSAGSCITDLFQTVFS